jgi:hypothetical protein
MTHVMRRSAALAIGVTQLGLSVSCTVEDGVLGGMSRIQAGGSTAVATTCDLTSPVVNLTDATGTQSYATCTGRIAATHFVSALCTCGDAQTGDFLVTGGFDSSLGSYQQGQSDDGGAAVGVNGNYSCVGSTDVGGSFTVAGANSVRFVGQLLVRGDFRAAGSVTAAGATTVSRNAWLGGSFIGLGPFSVAGELHHAASVTALPLVAGTESQEAVTTPQPCACAAGELLDVKGLVDRIRIDNDNSRLGINSTALAAVSGTTVLKLPCGRIFLDQVNGVGDVTIDVLGRLALFVGGSLNLAGALAFRLAPGAEVDVYVANDVAVKGQLTLSTTDRPSAGRLFVGGSGDIELTTPWIGNLYAPRCRVGSAVALEAWGSIFCRDFSAASSAKVVFDRAIVDAGRTCAPLPQQGNCSRCGWCSGGTACVAGACGPCRQDGDCCGQSVCTNGSCEPLVVLL